MPFLLSACMSARAALGMSTVSLDIMNKALLSQEMTWSSTLVTYLESEYAHLLTILWMFPIAWQMHFAWLIDMTAAVATIQVVPSVQPLIDSAQDDETKDDEVDEILDTLYKYPFSDEDCLVSSATCSVAKKTLLVTKYECNFAGCNKRFASTDGVRKHARKSHGEWVCNLSPQEYARSIEM